MRILERVEMPPVAPGPQIVAESPAMRELLQTVARVGPKDVTVLLRGETGTGKELIASLLHAQSARSSSPLVRLNCAAIPNELAEAELFGHTRGSFTGADRTRAGFFSLANGGTIVLDEVGELSPAVQAKLLRVLQEGEIQQVGAGRMERVDVRVIACTNRDLAAEARGARFRMDLFYRLAVVELLVPPLREHRPGDDGGDGQPIPRRAAARTQPHLSLRAIEKVQARHRGCRSRRVTRFAPQWIRPSIGNHGSSTQRTGARHEGTMEMDDVRGRFAFGDTRAPCCG